MLDPLGVSFALRTVVAFCSGFQFSSWLIIKTKGQLVKYGGAEVIAAVSFSLPQQADLQPYLDSGKTRCGLTLCGGGDGGGVADGAVHHSVAAGVHPGSVRGDEDTAGLQLARAGASVCIKAVVRVAELRPVRPLVAHATDLQGTQARWDDVTPASF